MKINRLKALEILRAKLAAGAEDDAKQQLQDLKDDIKYSKDRIRDLQKSLASQEKRLANFKPEPRIRARSQPLAETIRLLELSDDESVTLTVQLKGLL